MLRKGGVVSVRQVSDSECQTITSYVYQCVLLDMDEEHERDVSVTMHCQQEDLVGPVQCCLHSDLEADNGCVCECVKDVACRSVGYVGMSECRKCRTVGHCRLTL